MRKFTAPLLAISIVGSSPLMAADCGEPPQDKPNLPKTSQQLTADDIRTARNAVVSYSSKVTDYLTCMDNWIVKLRPYMTKEQSARFSDDTANLHEDRISLEQQMNEIIREYRRSRRSNNS
ncbi:hypothetical protein [Kordiimonas sp. SCSIO 12610]|uniref:hypothetical protein n=1 Tax=Kordiimonas sp. SCSIO 12610 TaxID=2829597 RepID=UPI00210CE958|nr:hypothetical protein [Kordiimonas sp. SCSIO 12610]UTW54866.1 hypothetical protein KFF44_13795 [Kordiimonas sp. SCSIO 12610]